MSPPWTEDGVGQPGDVVGWGIRLLAAVVGMSAGRVPLAGGRIAAAIAGHRTIHAGQGYRPC